MKNVVKFLLAFILLGALVPSIYSDQVIQAEEKTLKISAIPDFDQTELTRGFDSFAEYLSNELGIEVEYVPVTDYASVVTGFERGEIDLVWFGGLTGVQARALVPAAEAIAQRPMDAEFKSYFIKQKDLPIEKLEDLKGHSFAFGSESSTSGHLMPRYFLGEAGIVPEEDFKGEVIYSGSHDKTMALVEAGTVEAGAVNQQYWEQALEKGEVNEEKVEAFFITPAYFDYNWTIGDVDSKFGEGTKDKIKEALLIVAPEDSEVLEILSTEKFIETENDNYKSIEKVAKELGLIE